MMDMNSNKKCGKAVKFEGEAKTRIKKNKDNRDVLEISLKSDKRTEVSQYTYGQFVAANRIFVGYDDVKEIQPFVQGFIDKNLVFLDDKNILLTGYGIGDIILPINRNGKVDEAYAMLKKQTEELFAQLLQNQKK